MKPEDFEVQMRKGEYFHSLHVPEDMWFVVRLDGRGFTKMCKNMAFNKPFDSEFHQYMTQTTAFLMEELPGVFATTHSDEISILFPPSTDIFSREVEKIVSTSAAIASMKFSLMMGDPATFDSRIWIGSSVNSVADYFSWRMEDSVRGCINSYAYWLQRHQGVNKRKATSRLHGMGFKEKNEFLFSEFGVNFTKDVPAWQKRGTGFYFQMMTKIGYNPKTQDEVRTLRRMLCVSDNLPRNESFRYFVSYNLDALSRESSGLKNCFVSTPEQWGEGQ